MLINAKFKMRIYGIMLQPNRQTRVIIILTLLFIATLSLVTPYLRGDGVAYYAYVASIIIDGDLYLEDEFRHADPWHYRLRFDEHGLIRQELITSTGYIRNKFSVGPSLLWTPFFLLAHVFVSVYNIFAINPIPTDGFSYPYLLLCAIGTAVLGFIGLLLSYDIARTLYSERTALLAVLGIWLASALPVYMYFLPFMSHAHSVFICSLFVWYWYRTYPNRHVWQWLLLGFIGGLMVTTYYVNAVLLLILFIDVAVILRNSILYSHGSESINHLKRLTYSALVGMVGVLLGLVPHFVVKGIIYGSPFALGYGDPWWFASPRLVKVLFSSEHGLWTWTPIILFACVGFVPLIYRDRVVGWRFLLTFLVFYYVIASFDDWHGQSSFSNRFFLSLTPVFAMGLAALIDTVYQIATSRFRLKSTVVHTVVTGIIVVLILWNFGFIFQWGTNMIPNRGPISWRIMITNQFTKVPFRIARIAKSFFTERMSIIKQVEAQDIEEAKKYKVKR